MTLSHHAMGTLRTSPSPLRTCKNGCEGRWCGHEEHGDLGRILEEVGKARRLCLQREKRCLVG